MEAILTAAIPALLTAAATIITVVITNAKSRKSLMKITLRNCIQSAYYAYMVHHDMPMVVYQGVCDMYDEYKSLGGNSYIVSLKEQMDEWTKF